MANYVCFGASNSQKLERATFEFAKLVFAKLERVKFEFAKVEFAKLERGTFEFAKVGLVTFPNGGFSFPTEDKILFHSPVERDCAKVISACWSIWCIFSL